ncbi:MAG: TniB family NTP-binding protein [Ardenticatenaceae bacterium]|nr:TniB family NTP-binding protein [Ardenticatenaceae bacterium]MCB8989826.1 TniB family NTP-binding protein [Ardenticatenaceae bacterium]
MMNYQTKNDFPEIPKNFLIRYPRFNELHQLIRACQHDSLLAGEPSCLALEGLPGAGKSTLVQAYARTFPRYETENGTKIPVFYMHTPSPVTVKGMAESMLTALGDPAAGRGTTVMMNHRIVNFFEKCEIKLAILDDFHHLTNTNTVHNFTLVSDWLKSLIKETRVTFLVVGIEGSVEAILKTNKQLNRLFILEKLEPFQFDFNKVNTIEEFHLFVAYFELGLSVKLTSEIDRLQLLFEIHQATLGVVGYIVQLLRQATLNALRDGDNDENTIKREHLANAFRKWIARKTNADNPFSGKIILPSNIPIIDFKAKKLMVTDPPDSVNNRMNRRVPPKENPLQVFRAN